MNSTGIVGYIALLMILASTLWGGHPVSYGSLQASVLSSSSLSRSSVAPAPTSVIATPWVAVSFADNFSNDEKYVRVIIDGVPYEGTLHKNSIGIVRNLEF